MVYRRWPMRSFYYRNYLSPVYSETDWHQDRQLERQPHRGAAHPPHEHSRLTSPGQPLDQQESGLLTEWPSERWCIDHTADALSLNVLYTPGVGNAEERVPSAQDLRRHCSDRAAPALRSWTATS